jgi:hypothetical protein
MKIIIYQQSNGEILRCCDVPWAAVPAQLREGETYILGWADDSTEYVFNYEVVPRPDMDLVINSFDLLTGEPLHISGIPEGAEVTCRAGNFIVNDGFVEWTSMVDGVFPVYINCFPYKGVKINASFTSA